MTNIKQFASRFHPKKQLRTKYILYDLSVAIPILIISPIAYWLIYKRVTNDDLTTLQYISNFAIIGSLLSIILVTIGAYIYYPTIFYEIVDNEIHVFKGVITKTRKVVPYRTITNLEIKRGPYDRLLNIGTIEIQTAGKSSAKPGPEETINGIPAEYLVDLQEYIISNVRKTVGSPGTSQDLDHINPDNVLMGILQEIRELKRFLIEKDK